MKLLLDENLSYRLVARLAEAFPGTASIKQVGLLSQPDPAIWAYAAKQGFTIVSKDQHFRRYSISQGHPPKVVWLIGGNADNNQVADLLLRNKDRIATFLDDQNEDSLLILNLNDPDTAPSTR